jgi:hypothetical protein
MQVQGKTGMYEVTNEACTCPDYIYRQEQIGGSCKHMKKLFIINKIYKKFKTMKEATTYIHSLSNPSKMATCGYSISALECNVGGLLYNVKGSVCEHCYARKGHYIFPVVKNAHEKRLNKINNEPLWVDAMIHIINNKKRNKKNIDKFRWHDSGDLQSDKHLDMICEIARNTPNVNHWLPTKETTVVSGYIKTHEIPPNLNIRISATMIDGKPKDIKGTTTSIVISKEMMGKNDMDCPIYADDSHGKSCGDCEECYKKTVKNVNYLEH